MRAPKGDGRIFKRGMVRGQQFFITARTHGLAGCVFVPLSALVTSFVHAQFWSRAADSPYFARNWTRKAMKPTVSNAHWDKVRCARGTREIATLSAISPANSFVPYSVDSASTRIKRGLSEPCCAVFAMTSKLVLAAGAAAGLTGATFAGGGGACFVGELSAGAGLAGAGLLGSSNTGPVFEGCGAVTPCELFELPHPILLGSQAPLPNRNRFGPPPPRPWKKKQNVRTKKKN